MRIEILTSVIRPPESPQEVPDTNAWRVVETDLVKLPADYRDFVSLYGTGSIDSFIWVFNPASRNPHLNFQLQVQKQFQVLKEINQSATEPFIPLYPSLDGVLPFGITDNGDLLLWKTNGTPDNWTVGVLGARSSPILEFKMTMTRFLAGICGGSIVCDVFPEDFPSANPVFNPGF